MPRVDWPNFSRSPQRDVDDVKLYLTKAAQVWLARHREEIGKFSEKAAATGRHNAFMTWHQPLNSVFATAFSLLNRVLWSLLHKPDPPGAFVCNRFGHRPEFRWKCRSSGVYRSVES
jgi:hypothetical protein